MRGSQDPSLADDRPAAGEVSLELQRDLPRVLPDIGLLAADDTTIERPDRLLRNRGLDHADACYQHRDDGARAGLGPHRCCLPFAPNASLSPRRYSGCEAITSDVL